MEKMGEPQPGSFAPSAPPSYDDAMSQQVPAMPMPSPMQPIVQQNFQQNPYPTQPYPAGVGHTVIQPIVTQTNIVHVGPQPVKLDCPHCHARIKTATKTESQKSAHIACLILCLLGCCLCSCIPYCLSSFQDVHHKCPKCNGFIGTYKH